MQVIHENMEGQHQKDLAEQKTKLWNEYHGLRLEDEKRLRAKLAVDCLENLETARQEAVRDRKDDAR